MRAGTETSLASVIAVLGAAQPHCAYLFANPPQFFICLADYLWDSSVRALAVYRRLNQFRDHPRTQAAEVASKSRIPDAHRRPSHPLYHAGCHHRA